MEGNETSSDEAARSPSLRGPVLARFLPLPAASALDNDPPPTEASLGQSVTPSTSAFRSAELFLCASHCPFRTFVDSKFSNPFKSALTGPITSHLHLRISLGSKHSTCDSSRHWDRKNDAQRNIGTFSAKLLCSVGISDSLLSHRVTPESINRPSNPGIHAIGVVP